MWYLIVVAWYIQSKGQIEGICMGVFTPPPKKKGTHRGSVTYFTWNLTSFWFLGTIFFIYFFWGGAVGWVGIIYIGVKYRLLLRDLSRKVRARPIDQPFTHYDFDTRIITGEGPIYRRKSGPLWHFGHAHTQHSIRNDLQTWKIRNYFCLEIIRIDFSESNLCTKYLSPHFSWENPT